MEADIVDILDTFVRSRLEAVHTSMPGIVQSYDPDTRMATVVPAINFRSMHGEVIEIKPIPQVPVIWPGSSRFSVISASLQAGDGVWLEFSESSMGNWIDGNGPEDAEDETRFSLHDCVAIPGLWQKRTVPTSQDIGSADFGLVGSEGEVIGGAAGKLDLRNNSTDMRTEIEKLWKAVKDLSDVLKVWAPNTTTPGNPTVPTQAGLVVALQSGWTTDKAALKGLLA